MKLRELPHLLGWKPAPRTYGFEVRRFDLPRDGVVEYAQWLHPAETPKVIRQEVVDELRTFIRPGDVVVDIGAHTGDSAIPMGLAAGPTGVVLALEPNPYVFPVLVRNAALNADKVSIIPLNVAAMPTSGEYQFEYSDAGFCNGGRHDGISRWRHGHAFVLTVKGENLYDRMRGSYAALIPRLRYVKVDAEGYDLDVLRSIERLLHKVRPFIRAEVFRLSPQMRRQALVDFLLGLDYRLFRVVDETRYRGAPITAADVTSGDQFDVFAVPSEQALPRP